MTITPKHTATVVIHPIQSGAGYQWTLQSLDGAREWSIASDDRLLDRLSNGEAQDLGEAVHLLATDGARGVVTVTF